jgi:hypothetical protein
MKARDLELRSTIVFVDRDAQKKKRNLTRKEFIQEVQSVKPHFPNTEIQSALAELEDKGYVVRRED